MTLGIHAGRKGWRLYALAWFFILTAVGVAQTNSWVNPNSGRWDNASSWSLGILPGIGQSIVIQNTNLTTVQIDSATAHNYPGSLAVGSITLKASNTLAIANTAEEALTASNGIAIAGGALVMSNAVVSGFVNSSGTAVQNKGLLYGGVFLTAGNYFLTNGTVQGGVSTISGTFTQEGSNSSVTDVTIQGGTYNLHSGAVTSAELTVWAQVAPAVFNQFGGTNTVGGFLNIDGLPWGGTVAASYALSGGLLTTSNVMLKSSSQFTQSGGLHIAKSITIQGQDRYFPPQPTYPARFFVSGGELRAGVILINGIYGYSSFTEYGGTTTADLVQLNAAERGEICDLAIQSQFYCSNLQWLDGPVDITQSGNLVVSNLLSFGGYYAGAYNGFGARPAQYRFISGTLFASNIDLTADWIIYSSGIAGRVTNPGYFRMGGILEIGGANELLGRFVLTSNAVINFTGGSTILGFANSSAQTWSNGVMLVVSNWNGSLNGGGSQQLKFGTNAAALNASQLAKVRFVNPFGFPAGIYAAKILSTGEVVPYGPSISATRSGSGLVITWPDSSYTLQFATNVLGPWTNVVNATSPYTNSFAGLPQELFRLVR